MTIAFNIDLEIYPFEIRFSAAETDAEVKSYYKKKNVSAKEIDDVEYGDSQNNGLCKIFDSGYALIRMEKFPKTVKDYAVIQHEITHLVMFILFIKLQMPHNLDTTETYAYLTGFITEKIYNKLPKFRTK